MHQRARMHTVAVCGIRYVEEKYPIPSTTVARLHKY